MQYWACLYVFAAIKLVEFLVLRRAGHELLALGLAILSLAPWLPSERPKPWYCGLAWWVASGIMLTINLGLPDASTLIIWASLGLIAYEAAHPGASETEETTQDSGEDVVG